MRLLVDPEDVERLIAEVAPKPYRPDVDTDAASLDREHSFDMDTVLLEQLGSDKQKLEGDVAALSGRVAELEREVRRLHAEKATLVDAIFVIGQTSREAR